MNILQVISKLEANHRTEDLVSSTRFFTINGHKVIVVSRKSELVKKIDEVGAHHVEMAIGSDIFSTILAIFKLSRLMVRENIQVVHTRDPISSFVVFFASRKAGRAFISTVYGDYKKGLLGRAELWAKRVICSSETESQRLVNSSLVLADKLCVIAPFIETAPKMPAEFANLIQRYRGYFTVQAAVPLYSTQAMQNFVKAAAILSRSIQKLHVFIVGYGVEDKKGDIEKLKLLIKRHLVENAVTILSDEKVYNFDVFVQINSEETIYARLLLQAEGMGIPIVTTYASWLKDYFDTTMTGVVVEEATPSKMASRLVELYRNEKLRKDIGEKARNFALKKFSMKEIMHSTLRLYEEAVKEVNVLVIKIGALGDVILSGPSLRAIKEKFPTAKLKLLVGAEYKEVFTNSPFIDEIIACDFKENDKGVKGILRLGKRLRTENFDMVIDLQNNKKSHVLSFFSFAPKRYGYDNGKLSFLLNRKIKDVKTPLNPIAHQARVLALLGIRNINEKLELWPSPEDEKWVEDFLRSHWVIPGLSDSKENARLAAVNIESSTRWVTKLWPVDYFADFCNKLAKNLGMRIVLIGRDANNPRVSVFMKKTKYRAINALGKTTIPRLAALVKRCDLLLSSDSAPIHVASAMSTPFIALFGPTDPRRHVPPAAKYTVLRKDLPCAPCYEIYCNKGYICMKSIKPEEAYRAALKLLNIDTKKYEIRKD